MAEAMLGTGWPQSHPRASLHAARRRRRSSTRAATTRRRCTDSCGAPHTQCLRRAGWSVTSSCGRWGGIATDGFRGLREGSCALCVVLRVLDVCIVRAGAWHHPVAGEVACHGWFWGL